MQFNGGVNDLYSKGWRFQKQSKQHRGFNAFLLTLGQFVFFISFFFFFAFPQNKPVTSRYHRDLCISDKVKTPLLRTRPLAFGAEKGSKKEVQEKEWGRRLLFGAFVCFAFVGWREKKNRKKKETQASKESKWQQPKAKAKEKAKAKKESKDDERRTAGVEKDTAAQVPEGPGRRAADSCGGREGTKGATDDLGV